MSIVINTPNGHIGRALASDLLASGEAVTVISRSAEKAAPLEAQGARVVVGSMDDPEVLRATLTGATQVFWLTPPALRPDFLVWAPETARLAATLAAELGVQRAVVLSGAGAHVGAGTGSVSVLRDVEAAFSNALPHSVALRPGYFMENLLHAAASIHGEGLIFDAIDPTRVMPWVATADVAAVAARWFTDDAWSGAHIAGVHGPEDLTYTQVAARVGEALGRPVTYMNIPLPALLGGMRQQGMPETFTALVGELIEAVNSGLMTPAEPRTAGTTTTTTIEQFAHKHLSMTQ